MIRKHNQCNSKRPFETKEDASKAAKHLNQLGGKRVTVYKCPDCLCYHTGHNSKGNKLNHKEDMKRRKITHIHEPGVHRLGEEQEYLLKFKRK